MPLSLSLFESRGSNSFKSRGRCLLPRRGRLTPRKAQKDEREGSRESQPLLRYRPSNSFQASTISANVSTPCQGGTASTSADVETGRRNARVTLGFPLLSLAVAPRRLVRRSRDSSLSPRFGTGEAIKRNNRLIVRVSDDKRHPVPITRGTLSLCETPE